MSEEFGDNLGYQLADGSWSSQYKIGDKFVAIKGIIFSEGSIVEFIRDDSSWCPLFELVEGRCKFELGRNDSPGGFYSWEDLKPHKEQQ